MPIRSSRLVGLLVAPPVHLDRFVDAELAGQGLGQGQEDLGVVGVDADGAAEGVEALVGLAELEAELGEELVVLGVPRRGGDQVAAGLEGLRRSGRAGPRAWPPG